MTPITPMQEKLLVLFDMWAVAFALIDEIERCGGDVTEYRQRLAEQMDRLPKTKIFVVPGNGIRH